MPDNIIDQEKLENVQRQGDGSIICRCPACNLEGQDKTGNHLKIWPDNAFSCIVNVSDKVHNGIILQLVGTESDGSAPIVIPQPQMQIAQSWDVNLIKCLVKDYSYWEKRGISGEICEKFDMGIAVKGQMVNRAVIPIYNKDKSKLIGFTGRKLDNNNPKTVKWKHLGAVSNFCWPNTFNRDNGDKIILVESPGDSLFLYSQGITNNICLFGVNISGTIISYLIKINPSMILIGTNNEASRIGNEAAEKIYQTLTQFFSPDKLKVALPIGGKDFGEAGDDGLKQWSKVYWST